MACKYIYNNIEYTESELLEVWKESKMFSTSKEVETPAELRTKLLSFLNEFGITAEKIDAYEEHVEANGEQFTVRGFANMLNKTVKFDEGSLPEEVAHVAVEMFVEDSNSILEQVVNTDVYKTHADTYRKLYKGNETKVRKEILGKLVAQQIIQKNKEGIDGRLYTRIMRLWTKFKNWLNNDKLQQYIDNISSKVIEEKYESFDVEKLGSDVYYSATPKEQVLQVAIKNLKQRLNSLRNKAVGGQVKIELRDQIAILENDLLNNQADLGIQKMLRFFEEDSQNVLKYIEGVKANTDKLTAEKFWHLYDFVNYYQNVLEELKRSIYTGAITESDIKQRVTDLEQSFVEINNVFKYNYQKHASDFIGIDVTQEVEADVTTLGVLFGNLADMKDDLLRRMHFEVSKVLTKIHHVVYEIGKDLIQFSQDRGITDTSKFIERYNGKKTKYFLSEYKLEKFYTDYSTFLTNLRKEFNLEEGQYPVDKRERLAYNAKINDWKSKHVERKFVPAFYELFNGLSLDAKLAREEISTQIYKVLATVTDSAGNIHFDKLSDEMFEKLEELEVAKKGLGNLYWADGTKKEGTDLEIALEIKEVNEALKNKLESVGMTKKFRSLMSLKKRELSPEEYDKWLNRSSQVEYTKSFYDKLEALDKRDYGQEYNDLNEEKNELLKRYRNSELLVDETKIPEDIRERILVIETRMSEIRDNSPKVKSQTSLTDFAEVQETQAYLEELKKQKALGKDEYDAWFKKNHTINKSGHSKPLSFWTQLVPKDKSEIVRSPKRYWAETSEDSPWYNKNHNPLWVGMQPVEAYKNAEWNKLSIQEKEVLEELKRVKNEGDNLYESSEEKYHWVPQISASWTDALKGDNKFQNLKEVMKESVMARVDDTEFGERGVFEKPDGSQAHFVPKFYTQALDNPELLSEDLLSTVIRYRQMAERYKQFSEASSELELVAKAVGERKLRTKNSVKLGLETKAFEALRNFLDAQVYGIKTRDLGSTAGIDHAKVLGKFEQYVRNKNLIFNLFTILTSFTSAKANKIIENSVGTYVTWKSANFATMEYAKNVSASLSEMGQINKKEKLNLYLEKFGIGAEDIFNDLDKNRMARQIKDIGYLPYELVSHEIRSTSLIGVLHNSRYKDGKWYTSQSYKQAFGEDESFYKLESAYDMFEVKGNKLVVKPKYKDIMTKDRQIQLQLKAQYLVNQLEGALSPQDRAAAHQHAWLRLVTTHRNWLFSGISRRFKAKGFNYITETQEVGNYNAYWSLLKKTIMRPDRINLIKAYMSEWENLEDYEKVAVTRAWYEMGMAVALGIIAVAINSMADDDDDNLPLQYAAVIANRTLLEMSVFPSILAVPITLPIAATEAGALLNSPVVGARVLEDLTDVIQIFNSDEVKSGTYKGLTKRQRLMIKMTPGLRGLYISRHPESMNQFLKSKTLGWLYSN